MYEKVEVKKNKTLYFLFLEGVGGGGGGGAGSFCPQADEDNRVNNESSRTSLYGLNGFDRETIMTVRGPGESSAAEVTGSSL